MLYRIQQVLWRLKAAFALLDGELVRPLLSPELYALFRRMSHGDQHHALRVLQGLQAEGHSHPDLLVAALLHDCGKARVSYGVPERVLAVLAKKFAPEWAMRVGQSEGRGLLRALVVANQHPAWAAEDMAAAGASDLAISLARRHQESLVRISGEEDHLLQLLQAADAIS